MSERATVIPPPVKGCLMLNESPNKIAPGVGRGQAAMHASVDSRHKSIVELWENLKYKIVLNLIQF